MKNILIKPFFLEWNPEKKEMLKKRVTLEPEVRKIKELIPVLKNPSEIETKMLSQPAYFMYRGINRVEEKTLFLKNSIRHDITVIPALMLGTEFNKTLGHYHPIAKGSTLPYPEVYEVIYGKAIYLMQRDGKEVSEVIAVMAEKGDKVIMPPGYGHVTINPGKKDLIMANLVEASFKSDYKPYIEKKGAAYYFTKKGFIKNPMYKKVPKAKIVSAKKLSGNKCFGTKKNLYELFIENPRAFKFLKKPEEYFKML